MVNKAIIMVAGLGTRFLPATKAQPKEMLPLVDKPIIQFNVEEAVKSGVTEVIFVTGRNKRAIEDHFDYAGELEEVLREKKKIKELDEIRRIADLASFSYIRQKRPAGNGDALLTASHLIGPLEPFGALFGDDPIFSKTPVLLQISRVYEKVHAPVIALFRVPPKDAHKYGIVAGKKIGKNLWHISKIVEKPAPGKEPSNLSIGGRYILIPEIFPALREAGKYIKRGQELTLVDGFNHMLKNGHPIFGYEFEGEYRDCGSKLGFVETTVLFALKHPEVNGEFRRWLRKIFKARTMPKLP